jgi:hypothetical protein
VLREISSLIKSYNSSKLTLFYSFIDCNSVHVYVSAGWSFHPGLITLLISQTTIPPIPLTIVLFLFAVFSAIFPPETEGHERTITIFKSRDVVERKMDAEMRIPWKKYMT